MWNNFTLKLLNFLQYFAWGCWLITLATYFFAIGWTPKQFGFIYSAIGFSALLFPSFFCFLADRYFSKERVLGYLHLLAGLIMLTIPYINTPNLFFWGLLFYLSFYLPTMPLLTSYCYEQLKSKNLSIEAKYPRIRIYGTLGFISGLWLVSLTNNEASVNQFYFSASVSFLIFIASFFIAKSKPVTSVEKMSVLKMFGFDVVKVLKQKELYPFYFLAFAFGVALIISNGYTDVYVHYLKQNNSATILLKYPAIVVSVCQIAELIFIALIPYFLKHFQIKTLFLFSFISWIFKYFLLFLVSQEYNFSLLFISCVFYGIAFDLFLIPGSLYIEQNVKEQQRSNAQGLFIMIINGMGSLLGSLLSGLVIEKWFTENEIINWKYTWMTFSFLFAFILIFYIIWEYKWKFKKLK